MTLVSAFVALWVTAAISQLTLHSSIPTHVRHSSSEISDTSSSNSKVNLDTSSKSSDLEVKTPPDPHATSLNINVMASHTTNPSLPPQEEQEQQPEDQTKTDTPTHSKATAAGSNSLPPKEEQERQACDCDESGTPTHNTATAAGSNSLPPKEEQERQACDCDETGTPTHGTATNDGKLRDTAAFLDPGSSHVHLKDIGLMDPFFSVQFLEETTVTVFQTGSAKSDGVTETAYSQVRLGRTLKVAAVESNSQGLTVQHSPVPPNSLESPTGHGSSVNVHEANDNGTGQSGSPVSVRSTEAGRQAPHSEIAAEGNNESATVSSGNHSGTAIPDNETETILYHWGGDLKAGRSKQVINYRLHLIRLIPETTVRQEDEISGDETGPNWAFPLATLLFVIIVTLSIFLLYLFTTRSRGRRRPYKYMMLSDPPKYDMKAGERCIVAI